MGERKQMNCEDCIYTYPDCPYGDKYDLPIDCDESCSYKEVQLRIVFQNKEDSRESVSK